MAKLIARWHKSLKEINENQWNLLLEHKEIPFYKWQWLTALEESKSISNATGWQPIHLALWRDNTPIAIAPLYLKNHSYGEFIFDQAFARLAYDLGLNYYPKLIGMSPFSPVEGYRFFIKANEDELEITKSMMDIIDNFALENKILSCNFLYADQSWVELAESCKCATWLNEQSLWVSRSQKNFSDYLSTFNANQRRNIKRERKTVKNSGLIISYMKGSEINEKIITIMYNFYENHCAKWGPWGSKYLTQSFFETLILPQQREQLILFNAHRHDPLNPIAMSLCITDGQKLWGRYWGSKEEIDCLHFELCYYSPIEWALQNNIKSFDPGAGGTHKRRRGFIAKPNFSMHRWYDNKMNELIRNWLPQMNQLTLEKINAENQDLPIKIKNPQL